MAEYKILIVDDDETKRNFFKAVLKSLEANYLEAENGIDALALVKESKFDLIITDIKMPKMDGVEFCKQLKNDLVMRGIPIIMVSSFDSDMDIENGFRAGASSYIPMNEVKANLFNLVTEILNKSKFYQERLVLVVDDSRAICTLVEDGLARAGFRVILAENGRHALKQLGKYRPDLIITDIYMPEMNGFELCKTLHVDKVLSAIPVVIMSTSSDRRDMKFLLQNGAAAYIVKPFQRL